MIRLTAMAAAVALQVLGFCLIKLTRPRLEEASPEELEELGFEGGVYDAEAAPDIYSESILFEGADENALPTLHEDIPTKSAAYAYMVFNLLCMPCFAAVGAMKRELKTWKELGKAVGVQMLTAYVVGLLVNVVGGLFLN